MSEAEKGFRMGNIAGVLVAVLITVAAIPVAANATNGAMEMATGNEEFQQLVNFLQDRNGSYTYVDTRGHIHEFRTVRIDPVTRRTSKDGQIFWVEVSCRRNVVERRLGRVQYVIDANSIRPYPKDSSAADIAFFAYREFLAKRVLEE